MDDQGLRGEDAQLSPRAPEQADLVALCRELNRCKARYIVVGGFAVMMAGYPRTTGDVDLLIAADLDNEAKVFDALATLPDACVRELEPGDVSKYVVVRVADEIVVDLMASASGIDFDQASGFMEIHRIDGVDIPCASPELLWRMKSKTHRAKDQGDLWFLKEWFARKGLTPPAG